MEDDAFIEGLAQEIREQLGYRVDVEPGEKPRPFGTGQLATFRLPPEASVYGELPPVPPGGYAIKALTFSIRDGQVVFCSGSKLQPIGLGEKDLVEKVVSAVKGKLEAAAADTARIMARFNEVNADRIAGEAAEQEAAEQEAAERALRAFEAEQDEMRRAWAERGYTDAQLEEVRQRIRAMYGGPIKPEVRTVDTHQ